MFSRLGEVSPVFPLCFPHLSLSVHFVAVLLFLSMYSDGTAGSRVGWGVGRGGFSRETSSRKEAEI